MSKTTALIAIFTSVLLMTACGSQAEKQASDTAEATSSVSEAEVTTAAEEDEPEDESAADLDDAPFDAAYWEETERLIPVTYAEDFAYNGVTFKTMADVFAAAGDEPNVASSGNQFICVIENDDICTRFIANMPAELTQQHSELDIFDDDYRQKELDLVKDLKIARVDDLKAGIPSQEELDQYIGSSISVLENAGFEMNGWSIVGTEGEFTFSRGYYEYNVSFNEPLSEETDYYEAGAADELTVKSVTYSQLSYGAFNTDDLFGESETANAE